MTYHKQHSWIRSMTRKSLRRLYFGSTQELSNNWAVNSDIIRVTYTMSLYIFIWLVFGLIMPRIISTAQTSIFSVSRWFGASHFNIYGKPSKTLRIYMILTVLSVTSISLCLRITHLYNNLGKVAKATQNPFYNTAKYLLGFLMHFSILATCSSHLVIHLTHEHNFKTIFRTIKRTNSDNRGHNVIWLTAVFVIQLASTRNDVTKTYFYISGKFTVCILSIYSTIIALQFRCLLIHANNRLTRFVKHLREKRIYYENFSNLIDTCRLINKVYRWQILFILVQSFGYGVTYSYYLVQDYINHLLGLGKTVEGFDSGFYISTIVIKIISIWLVTSEPQNFKNEVS